MTFAYIEESPFRPGEYVGLGQDDVAFRIHRDASSSTWWAIERDTLGPAAAARHQRHAAI